MPCVALGQKKVYRASPARKRDRKIRNTQPISRAEKLKPETEALVKTAQVAVEVAASSPTPQASKLKTRPAEAKSIRKLTRGFKKIKTAALRRSAVKAARTNNVVKAEQAVEKTTATKSTPTLTKTTAIRLKDGDRIQIRQRRPRPEKKTAVNTAISLTGKEATVASAGAALASSKVEAKKNKITRALKKEVKASAKPKRHLSFHRPSRAELINAESRLGSTIFGPVPDGHRREFFHDRENIWIWHESWTDARHHTRQLTVRYEVRPSGVYKKLSAGKYFKLEGDELENFRRATRTYLRLIKQHIYNVA